MKRKTRKRTLIMLCIASMLVATIGVAFQTKAEKPLETLDPTLQQITFSNYGWDNGTYSGTGDIISKYGYGASLANKVISGEVTFSSDSAYMYIGGGELGIWQGLLLRSGDTDGNLVLRLGGIRETLTPDVAGVTLFNNPFNLKLSYQVIDSDSNGTDDALQLGVWFNDKLYNNEFFTVSTYVYNGNNRTYKDFLTGGLGIHAPGSASLKIASDVPEIEVLDSTLEQITFSHFGWKNETLSNMGDIVAKRNYKETLANKVISGDVTFSTNAAYLYIGGGDLDIWKGLYLKSGQTDGSLVLGIGGKKYPLTPTVAGVTLVNNPFNLKLSYQTVDTDEDGAKDTLKLGVWFNNKLYNNKYFMVSKFGDNYNRTYKDYLTGGLGIYAPPVAGGTGILTIASDETVALPTDYTNVTPFDFGIVYNTYSGPGAGEEAYGAFNTKSPLDSMNEVLFKTKITFGESTQLRYMRTTTSEWAGFEMQIRNDGSIYVINHLTSNNTIWVDNKEINTATEGYFMYPGAAVNGATTFIDQPLSLAFTTKFVACDEDGEVNDLKLGIWFNEKLYKKQFIYIKDCIDVCEQGLLLYRAGEGSIILESPDTSKRTETNERYNLADGPYLIIGTGTILVNGVKYENGTTLTKPGTYRIVSDNGALVRNVELYNAGETSSVFTHEDNVMPIAGFYGPHSNEYSDTVTEEVYQLLEDAGFNLINYIPKNWSVLENQAELIQNLLYAESHNMGLYVWDNRLLNSELTASALAKKIAPYSQYASFKGMHIIDEPGTASYHPDRDVKLDTYAPAAKAVNGYCNLSGYINLFPYDDYYGDYDDYNTYVDEYISKTEARMLSHDYYVFHDMQKTEYFENLSLAREQSLEHGIPFWPYIQAGSWRVRTNSGQPFYEEGTPNEGQFMWNVNTSLAYGAKGIQYYTMVMPYSENYTGYDYGILDKDGAPTDWYYYAKEINEHIGAIDEVLLAAESKAVLAIGINAKRDTKNSATSYGKLASVSLSDWIEGAVIGAFEYQGDEAFYVVNYDMVKEETITLNFAQSYGYRMIQNAVTSYGEGSTCTLTIPAGEAVLVVLNNNAISGMELQASITDSVAMTYSVTLDRALKETETPYMTFEVDGEVLANVSGIPKDEDGSAYAFTYPEIMVQDMAETIKATLTVGEYSKVYEYSVLDYCVSILNGSSYDNATKELIVDLVEYGATVQTYRGVAESDLLTTKLAAVISDYETFDGADDDASALESLDVVSNKLTQDSGVAESTAYKWKNVTLVLGNKVKIRARFTASDVTNLKVKVAINGEEKEIAYKADTQAGVYVLDFDEIYAYEYGTPITFKFYDGDTQVGKTLNYSVNTYLHEMRNYEETNTNYLKALLLAIHNYGKAAIAYN